VCRVLRGLEGDLKYCYRRFLAAGVSYAICMTAERTLGANNGSLRRVLRRRYRDQRDVEGRV
jgi:hypothetical protein